MLFFRATLKECHSADEGVDGCKDILTTVQHGLKYSSQHHQSAQLPVLQPQYYITSSITLLKRFVQPQNFIFMMGEATSQTYVQKNILSVLPFFVSAYKFSYFMMSYKFKDVQQSFFIWMDNNRAREESSSVSEDSDHYEEDQVVWAKIQGYPWWPAYISNVETAASGALYKVFFFGDNSHSRLNPSKIRKFQEFFPDFAPIAKKNQKLKNALRIAQAQLSENNEDVKYFGRHSSEPKKSLNLNQNERKSFENGLNPNQDSKPLPGEQPIKRRPGRPRKNNIIPITILSKSKEPTNKPQKFEQKVEKIADKQPNFKKIIQPQQRQSKDISKALQIQQEQDQQVSEFQNIEKIARKKIICKQILKAKRLIQRNLQKEAFSVLSSVKLDRQNILELLQLQILPKLQQKLSFRTLLKFKETAKKALLDRYFKLKHQEHLHNSNQHSVRGKVVRRLFAFFKNKNSPITAKKMALAFEETIRTQNPEKDRYIQSFIDVIKNGNVSDFPQTSSNQQMLRQ